MRAPRRTPHGFTLIELLVVIAIIGVLIGLLLPAVQKVREAANRSSCKNNMKQMALACHMYNDTNGTFPISYIPPPNPNPNRLGWWSWQALLLPYIEQGNLYNQLNPGPKTSFQDAIASTSPLLPLLQSKIKTYTCPSDAGGPTPNTNRVFNVPPTTSLGVSNYVGNNADNAGVFVDGKPIGINDVIDGTTNTILLTERTSTVVMYGTVALDGCAPTQVGFQPRRAGVWAGYQGFGTQPASPICPNEKWNFEFGLLYKINTGDSSTGCDICDPQRAPSSTHPGGIQAAMCDGSVQWINENVNWTYSGQKDAAGNALPIGTFNRLNQKADGLVVGDY